jgi:hypothetical protein
MRDTIIIIIIIIIITLVSASSKDHAYCCGFVVTVVSGFVALP